MPGSAVDRRRGWEGILTFVLGLIAAFMLTLLPAHAHAQGAEPDWAYLGPIGPGQISNIAVSDDWPRTATILARRDRDLIRSVDGGATWVRLAAPAPEWRGLTLAPMRLGQSVAFVIGSETLRGAKSLYRSGDLGSTWLRVFADLSPYVPGGRTLAIAPSFADDGLVLFVADGTLYRSDDGGMSWTDATPSGQSVQQALFSPNYARDRRIYLAASGGTFPAFLLNERRPATGTFDQAAGVMVSTDGGVSWEGMTAGLSIDEVSYRNVQAIAISPTFDQDRTLLAYAWAERLDESGVPSLTNERALFRSRDAGVSWDVVYSSVMPGDGIYFASQPGGIGAIYPQFALSPRFALDGVGLFAVTGSGGTPSSGSCRLLRSADSGTTWQMISDRSGPGTGCFGLQIFEAAGERYEVLSGGSSGLIWQRLREDGAEPTYFMPEGALSASTLIVTSGPPGRQVLLLGSYRGIWAFGVGMADTDGRLPCPATTTLGFDRVWQANRSVQRELACPTEAERPVLVWEQMLSDGRPAYGTGDSSVLQWYSLTPTGFYPSSQPVGDASGTISRNVSDQYAWPNGEQRIVQGAIQQFEGGEMLWIPQADGTRTILVLGNPHYWRFPD